MKEFVDQLWLLFKKQHPNEYSMSARGGGFIHMEIPTLEALSSEKGVLRTHQSHSNRSAWVYSPWKGSRWFAGYEYKGIGENGGGVRTEGGMVYGGVVKSSAIDEHRFAKKAEDAGVFCQKALGVYDYGVAGGKELAVVVRTFTSPIRLSDFLFDKRLFREYLGIRGQGQREYAVSIARTLGDGARKLFDIGLYHGSLGVNNITSEGEMADFEPTSGGTWEGVAETTDPFMRYVALRRILFAGRTLFPSCAKEFNSGFASSFFREGVDLLTRNPALEIAERYCGTRIKQKLERPKKGDAILIAIEQVEELKRNTTDKDEIRKCDYVLRTLRMPVPVRVED